MTDPASSRHPLFFIALLPGNPVAGEVTRFKQYAARYFRSSRALRSPPHITLAPPFSWATEALPDLEAALERFAREEAGFSITLRNFDRFAPRVIFVAVEDNETLAGMQRRLVNYLATEVGLPIKDTRPYHPHMTVAFKDLRRSVFPEAWAYFSRQGYERTFSVSRITLLRHNGREWEVWKGFPMKSGE